MRGSGWILAAVIAMLAGCAPRAATPPGAVAISVTDDGFVPAVATVPRGKPVTLIVTRRTDRTCATEMVFGSPERRFELPLGTPVRIDLPAGVSDTLRYACGMDMVHGMVVAR